MAKALEEERREADRNIAYLQAQLAKNVAGELTFTQHPTVPDTAEGLMLGINDWVREREIIGKLEIRGRVMQQVEAMGLPQFRIGVLTVDKEGTKTMQMFTWDQEKLAKSMSWLKAQNAMGANINIGPAAAHGLSLIDDIKRDTITKMKDAGFQPAVVVETSRNNFQAWVNHGQTLEPGVRGAASKRLAETFAGDPSAAAHMHMGKLAGFTNRKEIHRAPDGKYPWVHLVEATGAVYPRAKEFVEKIGRERFHCEVHT